MCWTTGRHSHTGVECICCYRLTLLEILISYYDTSILRQEVNPAVVAVFFFLYVFFVYFILANFFIVIIIDTYLAVTEAGILHGRELQVSDYIGQVSPVTYC